MKTRTKVTVTLGGIVVCLILGATYIITHFRKANTVELKRDKYVIVTAKSAQMREPTYGVFKITGIANISGRHSITFRYLFMNNDSNRIILRSPAIEGGIRQVLEGGPEGINFSLIHIDWLYRDQDSIWLVVVSNRDAREFGSGYIHNKICITNISDEDKIFGHDLAAFDCVNSE